MQQVQGARVLETEAQLGTKGGDLVTAQQKLGVGRNEAAQKAFNAATKANLSNRIGTALRGIGRREPASRSRDDINRPGPTDGQLKNPNGKPITNWNFGPKHSMQATEQRDRKFFERQQMLQEKALAHSNTEKGRGFSKKAEIEANAYKSQVFHDAARTLEHGKDGPFRQTNIDSFKQHARDFGKKARDGEAAFNRNNDMSPSARPQPKVSRENSEFGRGMAPKLDWDGTEPQADVSARMRGLKSAMDKDLNRFGPDVAERLGLQQQIEATAYVGARANRLAESEYGQNGRTPEWQAHRAEAFSAHEQLSGLAKQWNQEAFEKPHRNGGVLIDAGKMSGEDPRGQGDISIEGANGSVNNKVAGLQQDAKDPIKARGLAPKQPEKTPEMAVAGSMEASAPSPAPDKAPGASAPGLTPPGMKSPGGGRPFQGNQEAEAARLLSNMDSHVNPFKQKAAPDKTPNAPAPGLTPPGIKAPGGGRPFQGTQEAEAPRLLSNMDSHVNPFKQKASAPKMPDYSAQQGSLASPRLPGLDKGGQKAIPSGVDNPRSRGTGSVNLPGPAKTPTPTKNRAPERSGGKAAPAPQANRGKGSPDRGAPSAGSTPQKGAQKAPQKTPDRQPSQGGGKPSLGQRLGSALGIGKGGQDRQPAPQRGQSGGDKSPGKSAQPQPQGQGAATGKKMPSRSGKGRSAGGSVSPPTSPKKSANKGRGQERSPSKGRDAGAGNGKKDRSAGSRGNSAGGSAPKREGGGSANSQAKKAPSRNGGGQSKGKKRGQDIS
ncbi:hypothetical protein CKO28_13385 [Rhodovibrio sodomensis]|uniref:Uncharacterized protein n=2 Tax=Rhodovibrio sodomensis TaxID=1088 RepID=A0ABS1DEZ0_9PROT|nr:hypothetical protein [Rhodovibrio sodomensis]